MGEPGQTETGAIPDPAAETTTDATPPIEGGQAQQTTADTETTSSAPETSGPDAASAEGTQTEEAAAEQQPKKEIPAERQVTEISLVGDNLLRTKQREIEEKVQKGEALSEGEKKLFNLSQFERMESFYADDEVNGGIDVSQGKPMLTTLKDGRKVPITRIIAKRTNEEGEQSFQCYVRTADDTEIPEWIPAELLSHAFFVAEADPIKQTLSGDEQALAGLYITILEKGEKGLNGADLTATAQQTEKVAQAQGIITASDMESYLATLAQTPENAAQLEEVRKLLEGKNILDYQTVTSVIKQLDGAEYFDEAKVADYFLHIQEGRVDTEKARAVSEALRKGDQNELVELILSGMADLTEDEIEQKREELRALLGAAGHGLGVMLALLFNALTSNEAKAALKTLK